MSIGEFARLSRLSPKALRLYDELGLLPPARVDPDSGYRWYSATRLERARLVAALRQLRMPLAEIAEVAGLDADAVADRIRSAWTAAEDDHAARRELAGYLLDTLAGRRPVMYDITVRDVPDRTLLSLLRHAHLGELQPLVREFLIRRMTEGQVPRPHPAHRGQSPGSLHPPGAGTAAGGPAHSRAGFALRLVRAAAPQARRGHPADHDPQPGIGGRGP